MNKVWSRTKGPLLFLPKIGHSEQIHFSNKCNAILTLCKHGRLNEAMQILGSSDFMSISPDLTIYSSILQLCIDLKAAREGRFVHDHLMRNGLRLDSTLNSKLIILYGTCGDVDAARQVFDKMPERTIVSWTALISGYSRHGYCKEALRMFALMRRSGLRANQYTYGSAMKACTGLMCLARGKQVQACIQKSRFYENVFVQSALVDLYAKCGSIEDARYMFELMSQRDVVCWNAVIGGYAVEGLGEEALLMFRLMLREGMSPDHFTFGGILRAHGRARDFMKVQQIHGFIIQLGFESHNVVAGALIDAYTKCKSISSGRFLYDSMLEKDLISCTALITGYAHEKGHSGSALELFHEIHNMDMIIDGVIICSMLNICANLASYSLGRQIHAHLFKSQPNYDVAMSNSLIDMYSKSGEIKDARRVFDEMPKRNVISWTSLITGYGKHGYGDKAITLFEQMENSGSKPNDVTFLALISACGHTGLTNQGWQCFNTMISEYNIQPRAEHYSCVVDLLARAGRLEEAYNLVREIEVKPNASLWGAILGACSIYSNIGLGKIVAGHLFDLEPWNSANYIVLANIYAAVGLWEDAWNMRKLMRDRSLQKRPGCSFIEFTKERAEPFLLGKI